MRRKLSSPGLLLDVLGVEDDVMFKKYDDQEKDRGGWKVWFIARTSKGILIARRSGDAGVYCSSA